MTKKPLTIKDLKSDTEFNYDVYTKEALISTIVSVRDYLSDLEKENQQLKDNWNMLKEHLKNRYDNGTESISYRQVFMEIREAMQALEIAQELEKGGINE